MKPGSYDAMTMQGPFRTQKAPDGQVVLVVAATITSAGNARLDASGISASTMETAGATFLGIGTGPGFSKLRFISCDVVKKGDGQISFVEDGKADDGILFGVGKEAGIPYVLVGAKPVRLFMAFAIDRPRDPSFTVHFGNVSATGTIQPGGAEHEQPDEQPAVDQPQNDRETTNQRAHGRHRRTGGFDAQQGRN